MLEAFMNQGSKREKVFKDKYELFYLARLEDLREITRSSVPPIKSETHSLLFLRSGVLFMKIGSHSIKIHKNEAVIIPAGQVFSYSDDDNEKSLSGAGYICGFNDNFLIGTIGSRELLNSLEFLNIWGNPVIKLRSESANHIAQTFHRIFTEYTENGLNNKRVIQAYLIAALCDLNKDYLPLSRNKSKPAVELTNRFRELLHQKVNSTHKVEEYAAMLNISPNHLNKSVKLITHKSPSHWIRETLINEAKVLLFQTELTIQEVALEMGMEDQSYFARIFKKQEGMTPLEYRKMIDLS